MAAVPVLQAMLLADQVYQDRNTGKYVICGIFSAIFFVPKEVPKDEGTSKLDDHSGESAAAGGDSSDDSRSPGGGSSGGGPPEPGSQKPEQIPLARLVKAGSPYAYISLTELRGSRKFELRYVDLVENTVLFATQFEVSCRDPLETIQITVPLPPLPIPHEGAYALELLCDGELLGSHRVIAKRQPKP